MWTIKNIVQDDFKTFDALGSVDLTTIFRDNKMVYFVKSG